MGCVAIWPMIVPLPHHNHRHWVVVALVLSMEDCSNPGRQAPNVEKDVVDKSNLEPSTYYTMRMGINIPWMMQDNCMSPWNSGRLLLRELRRQI